MPVGVRRSRGRPWLGAFGCVGLAGVAAATGGEVPRAGAPAAPATRPAGAAPAHRQSPAALAGLWDAATLSSFSLSQLDALSRIASGHCPLLSRAVRCARHGGRRQQPHGGGPERWGSLVEAYLGEEAELARRQAVAMVRHIWRNYEGRAFGRDELKPVTGRAVDSWGGLGQTLVDSLDTLWLTGLRAEFHRAATWVERSLDFDKDINVNLFETSIRQLGGLLAAYALSRREGLLAKAEDLGGRLFRAYPAPQDPGRAGRPKGRAPERERRPAGLVSDLLRQMGLSREAEDAVLEAAGPEPVQGAGDPAAPPQAAVLPFSDVNLGTGKVQNLANFVSLAEAYVPIEWKALALLTGNCSYAWSQEEVLQVVNRSAELESRGLAPILLKPDGSPMPLLENRISLGSRGDSFYEYLLKDAVWSGGHESPLAKRLWGAFRAQLPALLVEAYPARALAAAAGAAAPGKRRRRRRRGAAAAAGSAAAPRAAPAPAPHAAPAPAPARGSAGAAGGWFETWRDAAVPWVFLREVGYAQSIPKIDHLVCFLPGTLALDVLRRGGGPGAPGAGRGGGGRAPDHRPELVLAHKLLQTCVHMYFRTASDLAPEITRFNAMGLVDDQGSMHNILRPETVESIFVLWRTTKAQIYRNWGQRLLAAFARMKTRYGYASLHNVNRPRDLRDDMPSFFVAETVKYLFLLFAEDSALSLEETVLTTEAHPLPTMSTASARLNARWRCGGEGQGGEAEAPAAGQPGAAGPRGGRRAGEAAPAAGGGAAEDRAAGSAAQGALGARGVPEAPRQPPGPAPSEAVAGAPPPAVAAAQPGSLRDHPGGGPQRGEEDAGVAAGPGDGPGECEARRRELTAALAHAEAELSRCSSTLTRLGAGAGPLAGAPRAPAAQALGAVPAEPPKAAPPGLPAAGVPQAAPAFQAAGDPSCWVDGYSPEACCWPQPGGNPLCWDGDYTPERCCGAGAPPSATAGAGRSA